MRKKIISKNEIQIRGKGVKMDKLKRLQYNQRNK